MDELKKEFTNPGFRHHAYLLLGASDKSLESLLSWFEEAGIREGAYPDLSVEDYKQFGIKEAQELKSRQSKKPLSVARYFILSFSSATPEAQNALLKTFEEPSSDTYFILLAPAGVSLLPTFLSRFRVITLEDKSRKLEFLGLETAERLSLVEEMVKEGGKKKAHLLLDSLEKETEKNLRKEAKDKWSAAAETVLASRRFLSNPRANLRLILEHLALHLPEKK